MNIREALPKVYEELPEGGKKRASEIHGVRIGNFKKIVDGEYKDESIMYSAFYSCLQAAKDCKKETDYKVSKVLGIEVDEPVKQ